MAASEAILRLALVHELGKVGQSSRRSIVWQDAPQSHCTVQCALRTGMEPYKSPRTSTVNFLVPQI